MPPQLDRVMTKACCKNLSNTATQQISTSCEASTSHARATLWLHRPRMWMTLHPESLGNVTLVRASLGIREFVFDVNIIKRAKARLLHLQCRRISQSVYFSPTCEIMWICWKNVVKYRHAYLQTLRRDGERGLGMQSNSRCHRTVVQQTNINQHKPTNIYLLHIQISSYQILKRTWNIWHRNMHVHGLSMCKRPLLSTLGARFTFLWPRTTWACPNPPVIAQHRAKLTSNVTRGVQLSQRTFVMTFVMTFLHDDFHSEIILPWYPGASHIGAFPVLKQLHSWWQDKRTYPIPGSCFDCALHTDLAGSLNWVPMGYRWLQYHILKWSPINQ